MIPLPKTVIYGWVPGGNDRGTRDILFSSLTTIWLCTWTCLYLHTPHPRQRDGWRALFYKFQWQLFTVFFPEVLVAVAAEQWLSARQSVTHFCELGFPQWTIRHGFYADMGGILVAPKDCRPFVADSQQLAWLVENKYMPMPDLTVQDIKALNKADGLARFVTLVQMAWFVIMCIARGIQGLGITSLEVTSLAFIFCTLHTFYFWYYKPLDPLTQKTYRIDGNLRDICEGHGVPNALDQESYQVTPLDFIKPPPDPRSLIAPFWFGVMAVFSNKYGSRDGPAQTLPNSRTLPENGVSLLFSTYILLFQGLYFGLLIGMAWVAAFPSIVEWYVWTISNSVVYGLILLYVIGIPVGTAFAPCFGRRVMNIEVTSLLELAGALPQYLKFMVHAPFVFAYLAGRLAVLVESLVSLRAMPASVYQDVLWTGFLPHL